MQEIGITSDYMTLPALLNYVCVFVRPGMHRVQLYYFSLVFMLFNVTSHSVMCFISREPSSGPYFYNNLKKHVYI